ncbi:MAG: GGDEF domain-containing protein, partial [Treponema sp.]|nr:GGDEF domain-containing protein [Treponema sp.]
SDIPEGLFASAAFLDMDQFKQYNDSYGHKEGDRILRELVNSANQSLRKEDLIVRYGGDEFIILMKENDITTAAKIIERIRDNFRRSVNLPEVDFSYGLSIIGDSGTLNIAELDRGMYVMKEKKRSTHEH